MSHRALCWAGGHAGCMLASGDMGTGRLQLEFKCQHVALGLYVHSDLGSLIPGHTGSPRFGR